MNTVRYPLEAVALDGDGIPWYPFRPTPNSPVLFLKDPVLTIPGALWEVTPPEYTDRPHIRLDRPHLAELVYFTRVPGDPYTALDPDQIVADELMRLLTGVLTACRCDPQALDAWLVDEYAFGQHRARLDRCRAAVCRLIGPDDPDA
jgi:hypothetical protein